MRIVWVHIEIYDFWLETLVLWHLSTVWDSIEIIGVFFLGETSEKQITFLSYRCLGETAKIFKKSPWDYSHVCHFEFSTSRGNVSARSCSYEKHLRQSRFLNKTCLKTQLCLLSNEWASSEHAMNFKTNENSMDLEDLMRNIWFYIEISDFWLQTF